MSITDKLDEMYNNEKVQILTEQESVETLEEQWLTTAIFIVPMALSLASKAYKTFMDKAEKTCRDYTGPQKTDCLKRFRAQAVKAQMAQLQKGKSMCGKDRNPEKCRARLDDKLAKLNVKLKTIMF